MITSMPLFTPNKKSHANFEKKKKRERNIYLFTVFIYW